MVVKKPMKPMVRLSKEEIKKKQAFIENYLLANNPSDGSAVDANANVSVKTVATLGAELNKDINIQINRQTLRDKIEELYGFDEAEKYIEYLENHTLYKHDETSIAPGLAYCVSINMYPFLEFGMQKLGGESKAPKHLESFCGSFVNLVFAISSQFAGAVATAEMPLYFYYFAKKDYGKDFLKTHRNMIESKLQHIVYSLNQPAAARGYQCVREDTELWTPEGWKKYSELKEGDECYTVRDGKFVVSKINKINVYDYDGNLIQFSGRNVQETVTPNHRVYYNINGKYLIKEAKDLVNQKTIGIPIAFDNEFRDFPIDDKLLELCTYALTDGIIEYPAELGIKEGRLSYALSKNRKAYAKVKQYLEDMGIGFSELTPKSLYNENMVVIRLTKVDSQIILRQLKHTKKTIPFFFKLLSQRQSKIVLNCWSETDGKQVSEEGKLLQCDSENIANDLQEVALRAGYGSRVFATRFHKISHPEEYSDKETYYLEVFARNNKNVNEVKEVPYKGKVWCPSTDDGIVVFREENKIPYVSGNSVFHNLSVFDRYFFDSMFGKFYFPDGTHIEYEEFNEFQKFFMEWLRVERTKSLLTFPVLTEASLNFFNEETQEWEAKDKEWEDFCAEERSKGLTFFSYNSETVDALASCVTGDTLITLQSKITGKEYVVSFAGFIKDYVNETIKNTEYRIKGINPETSQIVYSDVTGILKKKYHGNLYKFTVFGNSLKTTGDHIFLVNDGRQIREMNAKEIYSSENKLMVQHFDGFKVEWEEIVSKEELKEDNYDVYDLEMKEHHYFIGNNIVTHNCCRLKNELEKDNEFAYTLGFSGLETGSHSVITINLNRLFNMTIYDKLGKTIKDKKYVKEYIQNNRDECEEYIMEAVEDIVHHIHKFQYAHRMLVKEYIDAGIYSAYTAGFIHLDKQFSTLGM